MTHDPDWSQQVHAVLAGEVRRRRTELGWTAKQLADATADLGHPIDRTVIANLETGRKRSVSVAELLVLAAALRTVPLMLVFPVGPAAQVDVTPLRKVDPVSAIEWAAGHAAYEQTPPVDRAPLRRLQRYRAHQWAVERWQETTRHMQQDATRERDMVAYIRLELTADDLALPPIPDELAAEIERHPITDLGSRMAQDVAAWARQAATPDYGTDDEDQL